MSSLRLTRRWAIAVAVAGFAAVAAAPLRAGDEPTGTRIVSVVELDAGPAEVPANDEGLLALAKGQGRALPAMDAASYIPFAAQWLVLRL